MQFLNFAQGKKTYAIAAIGVAMGVIDGLNAAGLTHIVIPGYVLFALSFLGLGTLRAGVQAQAANTTATAVDLVRSLLAAVAVHPAPAQAAQAAQNALAQGGTLVQKAEAARAAVVAAPAAIVSDPDNAGP